MPLHYLKSSITSKYRIGSTNLAGLLLILVLTACGQTGYTEAEHLERALAFEQSGDHAASVIELKNVLQQNPSHAEARWRLGIALLAQADAAGAVTELERARALGWEETAVVLALARARVALGEHREVLALLEPLPLTEAAPEERRDALVMLGRARIGLDEPDAAQEAFAEALTLDEQHAPALIGLARIAVLHADIDTARELLADALAADPAGIEARELLGQLEQATGRLAEAEQAWSELIRHAANPYTGHHQRALVRLARDDPAGAREDLAALQQIADQHPLTHYVAGAVRLTEGDFAAASAHFDAVLETDPNHPLALYYGGLAHYASNELPRAERYLSRFLNQHPGAVAAARALAELRLRQGDAEGARQLIRSVVQHDPEDPVLLDLLASVQLLEGRQEEAIGQLEHLTRLQPESPRARARLAAALLQAGERERGLAEFDIARELAPEAGELDAALISYHLQQREFTTALEEARQLAAKQPELAAAHNLVGLALLGLQRHQDAEQAFATTLQRAPGDYRATRGLGTIAMLRGDPERVRGLFRQALEHRPDALELLLELAHFETQQGNTERGVELTQRAVEAHPQALQPRLILARHHLTQGEGARALAMIEPVAEAHDQEPALLEVLARAQLSTGRTESGISHLHKLVRLQPEVAGAHWLLGAALGQTGRSREARDALNRVLELEPEHPQALQLLSDLERTAGNAETALPLARRLERIPGQEVQGLRLRAEAEMALGNDRAAAGALASAYRLAPSPEIAIRLYTAQRRAGDAAAGLEVLNRQLQRTPEHDLLRLAISSELLEQGDHGAAVEQLERVFQRRPESYVVANNLALAYHQLGDARALETARRAHALESDDPRVLDTLGLILWAHGDHEEAVALLRRAHEALPDNPTVRFHYARALADTGQRANARISLSELLAGDAVFPEEEEARVLLQSLR